MPIQATCPKCMKGFRLADSYLGKRVRCTGCQSVFQVEAAASIPYAEVEEDEPPLEVHVVRKRPFRDDAEVDDDDRPAVRRPRRKKAAGMPTGLIIGGVVAGVLLLCLLGGTVVAFVLRSSSGPNPPVPNPAPTQPPVLASNPSVPVPPPSSADTGGAAITLSNPSLSQMGLRISFNVNYRFERGSALPGTRYFLVIKSKQDTREAEFLGIRLGQQGTLEASGFELHGDPGPFELFMEVQQLGLFGQRQRCSNTVSVNGAFNGMPGVPRPGDFPVPPMGPPGFQPPFGPPGIRPPRIPNRG